jgi:hypothetical protein
LTLASRKICAKRRKGEGSVTCSKTFLTGLVAALMAPAPAHAEQPADSAIVVTGQVPLTENEARAAVRRLARPVEGQLARFHERVCPAVIGFEARYEAMVAGWIRATAETVGAEVAGQGCTANLLVVIVDDGAGFVRALAERDAGAFSGLPPAEFAELAASDAAARSWTVTLLTNSAGSIAARPSPSTGAGAVRVGFAGSSVSFGDAEVLRVYEASNANPSVQQAIHSSWVVLETEATLGKSLRQVADYAAMRGLAMVRPEALAGSELTILDLFEPGARASPAALTEFDRAYLTSLYRAPPRRWARSQVGYIANAMARQVAGQAPP